MAASPIDEATVRMPVMTPAWRALACLLLSLLLCSTPVCARTLAQYQHRMFGAADGVPDEVVSIAQSRDGMMWIGATTGIYRFDGLRFERQPVDFSSSPRQPYVLRGDPAGGIWIGWLSGGISYLRGRAVRHYDVADGIQQGTVWGFAFDRQGRVWAAGKNGLSRFDGRRWQRMGAAEGFDAAGAAAVNVDPEGNVGVFTEKGLYLWTPGARSFAPPRGATPTRQPLAIGPQGQLYFMQQAGIRRIASIARYERPDFPLLYRETEGTTGSFLADRDGGLWFDSTAGLHRLAHPEQARPLRGALRADTETITQADGLSGRVVYCMFEDDRGGIWVATDGGLDRFTPSELESVVPDGRASLIRSSVVAAGDGGAWLLTVFPRQTWMLVDAAGRVRARHDDSFDGAALGEGGELLAASADGRVALLGKAGRRAYGPPLPGAEVSALARDGAGGVLVALADGRVLRGDGKTWEPVQGLPAGRVMTIRREADGIWFGYQDNRIAVLAGGKVRAYGAAQGLSVGSVNSIARVGATLWVAGARGLNGMDGARFHAVPGAPGMFDDLADILGDGQGALWLTGRSGLMVLAPGQLARCARPCAGELAPMLYDAADGLKGRSVPLKNNQLALDDRGRVWVATGVGVFRVDSRAAARARAAPQALVTAVAAAGRRHATPDALRLPPGTHDVQVDYTAPAPDRPERVRFRYRLAGYDAAWQEARTRRQAFYTGLAPGRYGFEVAAALDDSGWSAPARLALEILPAWYQTWWFRALCVLALLGGLGLAYRLRVRQLTRRVRARAEARQQERERIARELHDTVLQTNAALLLQLKAVAAGAGDDPLARKLETMVGLARATLEEGRDRVAGLRMQQHARVDFVAELEQLARIVLHGSGIAVQFKRAGTPWPLDGEVAAECLAIVGEAVINARKHSGARLLRLAVRFERRCCEIVVADDGQGIPPEHAAGRDGHWGLAGMRERAALVGARIDIDGSAAGTTVRLRIPRRRALPRAPAP